MTIMAPKRYKKKSSPSAGTMHKHLIKVPVPANFDLGLAVSSYGFFMLAPNRWVKVFDISDRGFANQTAC